MEKSKVGNSEYTSDVQEDTLRNYAIVRFYPHSIIIHVHILTILHLLPIGKPPEMVVASPSATPLLANTVKVYSAHSVALAGLCSWREVSVYIV